MNDNNHFRSCECPVCKKVFIPAPQHVFVFKKKTYCSWTCFNKVKYAPKVKEKKHTIPGKPNKPVLQRNEAGETIGRYSSVSEAAEAMGVAPSCIRSACNQTYRKSRGYYWRFEVDVC